MTRDILSPSTTSTLCGQGPFSVCNDAATDHDVRQQLSHDARVRDVQAALGLTDKPAPAIWTLEPFADCRALAHSNVSGLLDPARIVAGATPAAPAALGARSAPTCEPEGAFPTRSIEDRIFRHGKPIPKSRLKDHRPADQLRYAMGALANDGSPHTVFMTINHPFGEKPQDMTRKLQRMFAPAGRTVRYCGVWSSWPYSHSHIAFALEKDSQDWWRLHAWLYKRYGAHPKTERGGMWHAGTVKNVVDRIRTMKRAFYLPARERV
jgi:hypothetical protein